MESIFEIINTFCNDNQLILSTFELFAGAIINNAFVKGNRSKEVIREMQTRKIAGYVEYLLDSGQITTAEYIKANKFSKVCKLAEKYDPMSKFETNKGKYNYTWFINFFNACENISDETLFEYWARMLAGEMKMPDSFSLRVIDLFSKLRKCDIELLQSVSKYILHYGEYYFIPNSQSYLEQANLTRQALNLLKELNLIFDDNSVCEYKIDVSSHLDCIHNDEYILITGKEFYVVDEYLKHKNAEKLIEDLRSTDLDLDLKKIIIKRSDYQLDGFDSNDITQINECINFWHLEFFGFMLSKLGEEVFKVISDLQVYNDAILAFCYDQNLRENYIDFDSARSCSVHPIIRKTSEKIVFDSADDIFAQFFKN